MIKNIIKFIKKFRLDILFILITITVVVTAWHGVLNQIIEGEGYYYFSPTNSFFNADGKMTDILHEYDNFPRLSYYLLEHFFGGNIQPYMNFQFVLTLLLHCAFYLFVRFITKQPWIALMAAVYFAANYSGNYQIYARGHFQWFTQRVPELFPVFISAGFLISYINSRKTSKYLWSLVFFFIAVITNHYTSIIMPLFPALMISSALVKGQSLKDRVFLAMLGIPFVLINYSIVNSSSLAFSTIKPNQTFWQSIVQTQDAITKVLHQLVVTTIPFSLLKVLSSTTKLTYPVLINGLMIPIVVAYAGITILLFKRKFVHFYIFLGLLIALLGTLFLNAYVKRTNLFNEIEQGRYYFIPGIYIGLMYALTIYNLLIQNLKQNRRAFFNYSVVVILLLLWVTPNVNLIWTKMQSSQYQYTGGRLILNQLKELTPTLPSGSAILLPNPIMPNGTDFLIRNYSKGDITFLYIDSKWQQALPENFDPNNLFVFDYNEEYRLGGRSKVDQIRLIDISEQYRQKLK